jgi:hypothetical protein
MFRGGNPMQSQSPIEVGTEQPARFDSNRRRELGGSILDALAGEVAEDTCLNPNGRLWIKRMVKQFMCPGTMLPVHALSVMGTITVPITPLPSPLYFGRLLVAWPPEDIMSVLCLKTICNLIASCEIQP